MSADTVILKPCPFCGASAGWVTDERGIECGHCAAAGPWRDLREADWNTRPVEDALRARAEKAEAALAAVLAMLDADLRHADNAALALRYDAARTAAAGDAEMAAHLSRAANRHNATRVTLGALLIKINDTIAKATKEPTT